MSSIVETVSYKLAEGVSREAFLGANGGMTDWLSRQQGCRYRSLSQKDDGTWIDIVYWEDQAAADAAEASFQQEMLTSDFLQMVDQSTLEMAKTEVVEHFAPGEVLAASSA